ncbi:LysR family transcriptional regulator [Streptomyces sp. 4503]|uniref:LysR family transcriptional regulator n=2 Tax=Streptomyces niphimycinicus TaxID=2842201 RepID=A0ABS6C8E3_9ACTN|nr:LysR family transcriptional regulator [Streptomyces niphimycinicus]
MVAKTAIACGRRRAGVAWISTARLFGRAHIAPRPVTARPSSIIGTSGAAAEQLRLSPPATSRAPARLRRAMEHPILVRAGRGLVPTPFALRSAPRVRALLEGAAELVTDATGSEPHTWRRSFAVRIHDGLAPVLVPRLIGRITAEPPASVRDSSRRARRTPSVPVRGHEIPFDLPRVTVDQRWHRGPDSDRPSQWLRGHVVAALEHLVVDDAAPATGT